MGDDLVGGGWKLDTVTTTALRLELARKALAAGDAEQCAIEAEEVLDDAPDSQEALCLLAVASTDLGDPLTAREAWKELGRLDGRAHQHAAHALAAYETASFAEAEAAARAAVAKDDAQAQAWWVLGRCAERRGAAAEARACFFKAHLLSPHQCLIPRPTPPAGWEPVVVAAMDQLDDVTGDLWRSVELRLESLPDEALLTSAVPPLPPGLLVYSSGADDEATHPTVLRVFVGNLAHAPTLDDAADRLADALEEEAGAWGEPG